MTAILALANSRQAIQLSERRLTAWDGKVADEHSNKATVLVCANGRFSVGYTGLAYYRSFRTQPWILDSLLECGAPEFGIGELVERFMRKAERDFDNHPDLRHLDRKQKRLTVMFTGYLYREKPLIGNVMMTNFQDWTNGTDKPEATPNFWACWELQPENTATPTLMQRIGAWKSIATEELNQLRTMLAEDKPSHAIIEKGCTAIRKAAERPAAGNSVGKEIMSVVVPSQLNDAVTAAFKPVDAADISVLPDLVIALPSAGMVARDITFGPVAPVQGQPFIRPLPGKNQPCWCGSRKRFKKYHGRNR